MKRGGRTLANGLLALLAGCAGTETGNPSFDGELAYDAYSSEVSVAALREGERGAVVQQAWLVLGDVELLATGRCEEPAEGSAHAAGLGAGDHAMQGAARSPFRADIGEYCGLSLPFLRAAEGELPDGAPAALEGHSVLLTGTLPERSDLPFEIASRYDQTLVLAADDGVFELGPDQARLLLTFDVARWLEALPLDSLEPDDDGALRIDEDSHPELLQELEAALSSGVELRADPEGAGLAEEAGERLARAQD